MTAAGVRRCRPAAHYSARGRSGLDRCRQQHRWNEQPCRYPDENDDDGPGRGAFPIKHGKSPVAAKGRPIDEIGPSESGASRFGSRDVPQQAHLGWRATSRGSRHKCRRKTRKASIPICVTSLGPPVTTSATETERIRAAKAPPTQPFDKRLIRGKIHLRRNAACVASAAGSRCRPRGDG